MYLSVMMFQVGRILFHSQQSGQAAKADEAIFLLGCCLFHKYEKHLPLLCGVFVFAMMKFYYCCDVAEEQGSRWIYLGTLKTRIIWNI